ncbi:MAG: inositol 2-dehydrogenase [Lachnospiraceae bacterium]|nr:inositol 2-dehydrogenase [Lachnospiraceae bacterium]
MINVGIIGAGRIGQVHMKSIMTGVPEARVLAVADPYMKPEVAAWLENAGVEKITKDYREILDDPRIDAVLICASTDQHAPLSIEAIRAGKHVFCEKPVDHSLERIEEVKAALEASPKKIKYQVGFNRRFDHNYRAIRKAVEDGKIGKVEFIRISSRDPEPPSPAYVAVSGGIFLDMMIHDLDMLRYLSGDEVEEVTAYGANLVDPEIGKAGDVDTVVISAKLKGGALAAIDGCRKAVYGYDQRGEVFGSKGCITSSNDAANNTVLSTADGIISEKPLWFFLERYMGAYQEEIRSFIDCIVNDTEPEAGIEAGLISVKLAIACKKSMDEHRAVRIDEIK